MWKNFLSFSGSQRAGILILFVLIILLTIIRLSLPLFLQGEPVNENDTTFIAESEKFLKSLRDEKPRNYNSSDFSIHSYKHNQSCKPVAALFEFNPNLLDSIGFIKLGLKPWLASNILKYRKKGGKFKNMQQFSKVYGLDSLEFLRLKPYVRIPPEITEVKEISTRNVDVTEASNEKPELNSVDTTGLVKIKGINASLARRIVAYRNKLGGFYDLKQLSEIYFITPEKVQILIAACTLNPACLKKININTASVEKLKSHPYLDFWQAKAIYDFRRKKGRINNMSELNKIDVLDEETQFKIANYFNFN